MRKAGFSRSLLLATVLLAMAATGCSIQAPSANSHDGDHLAGPNAQIIGRHIYTCDDDAQITVDFLADGLTIELRSSTDGKPARLTAPGQGLRYMGDRITADATGGQMTIDRAGHATQACRRI